MRTKTKRTNFFAALRLYNSDPADGGTDTGLSGGGGTEGGPVTSGTSTVQPDGTTHLDSSHVHSEEIDLNGLAAEAAADAKKGAVDWKTAIPEEYREKPYIQNILKTDDPGKQFFAEMDNLQKKLGERVDAIPKPDAPKEEWDKFHKAMGRPDSADEYEFPKTQWAEEDKPIGEFIDSFRGNGDFEKEMKGVFFSKGLSKADVADIAQQYDQLTLKHNKQFFSDAANQQKEWDKDYESRMTEVFGSRAVQVQENGRALLKESVPAELKPMVDSLDSKSLTILAGALDGIRSKYIKEDGPPNREANAGFADVAEARKEGMKLMASEAWKDPMHPNHESVKKRVSEIYKNNVK